MTGGKKRVYEAAKEMGMSSEALVAILKSMSVEVKSHMSSIGDDVIEQVRLKLARDKEAVKEEEARRREKAIQAAKAAEAAARRTPPPGGLRIGGGGPNANRPGKKKKRAVDEKLIAAAVRRTVADMGASKRKHHHRDREEEVAVGVEEAPRVIRVPEFVSVAELAARLEVKPQEVIAACLRLGIMANINRRLDRDSIMAVADEFGFGVDFVSEIGEELEAAAPEAEALELRAPVVTVMG